MRSVMCSLIYAIILAGLMQMVGLELPRIPLTRIANAGSSKESARRVGTFVNISLCGKQAYILPHIYTSTFCVFNQVINREQAYFVKLLAEKSL